MKLASLQEAKYRSSNTYYTEWVKEQMEKMRKGGTQFIERELEDNDEIRTAADDLTAGLGEPVRDRYSLTGSSPDDTDVFWMWKFPDGEYQFLVIVNSHGELFVERTIE